MSKKSNIGNSIGGIVVLYFVFKFIKLIIDLLLMIIACVFLIVTDIIVIFYRSIYRLIIKLKIKKASKVFITKYCTIDKLKKELIYIEHEDEDYTIEKQNREKVLEGLRNISICGNEFCNIVNEKVLQNCKYLKYKERILKQQNVFKIKDDVIKSLLENPKANDADELLVNTRIYVIKFNSYIDTVYTLKNPLGIKFSNVFGLVNKF